MGEEKATPFVVYEAYYLTATRIKNKEERLHYLESVLKYGLYGEEPDFSQMSEISKAIAEVGFDYVSQLVPKSKDRYKAAKENGKKGGNPNFKKGKPNPYYPKKDNPDNLNINSNKNTNKSNSYYSTGDVGNSVMPIAATPEKEVKPPNPIDSQFRPVFD